MIYCVQTFMVSRGGIRNTAVLQASPAGPASHHRQQKPQGIQLPLQTKRDHPNEAAITPGHMIKLNMTP